MLIDFSMSNFCASAPSHPRISSTWWCKLTSLAGIAIFLAMTTPVAAREDPDAATPLELARVPEYCRLELAEKRRVIPIKSCGWYMNHYCGALIFLLRANDYSLSKWRRQDNARRARVSMNYTTSHMLPECVIANDVRAADLQLRVIESLLK